MPGRGEKKKEEKETGSKTEEEVEVAPPWAQREMEDWAEFVAAVRSSGAAGPEELVMGILIKE